MKHTINKIRMLIVSLALSVVLLNPGASYAAQDAAPKTAVAASVTDASAKPAPKLPDTSKASTGDSTTADKKNAGKAAPKVPETAGDAVNLMKSIFDAISTGNWPLVGILGLMLGVLLIRLGAKELLPDDHFLNSKLGGYATVFVLSAGAGISAVLTSSVKLDFRTVSVIIVAAFAASGIWQALKDATGKKE